MLRALDPKRMGIIAATRAQGGLPSPAGPNVDRCGRSGGLARPTDGHSSDRIPRVGVWVTILPCLVGPPSPKILHERQGALSDRGLDGQTKNFTGSLSPLRCDNRTTAKTRPLDAYFYILYSDNLFLFVRCLSDRRFRALFLPSRPGRASWISTSDQNSHIWYAFLAPGFRFWNLAARTGLPAAVYALRSKNTPSEWVSQATSPFRMLGSQQLHPPSRGAKFLTHAT